MMRKVHLRRAYSPEGLNHVVAPIANTFDSVVRRSGDRMELMQRQRRDGDANVLERLSGRAARWARRGRREVDGDLLLVQLGVCPLVLLKRFLGSRGYLAGYVSVVSEIGIGSPLGEKKKTYFVAMAAFYRRVPQGALLRVGSSTLSRRLRYCRRNVNAFTSVVLAE